MKIIPSVPTHALNLCSVAARGAAERIEFDSNRWISRCELTVCYHRWMQWWRNDAGNNLLALQKSYGLYFATINRCLCLLDGLILLHECFFENVPVWHAHVDDSGWSFTFSVVAWMGGKKRSRFICVIKILEHICNVYRSCWTRAKQFYRNSPLLLLYALSVPWLLSSILFISLIGK